MSALLAAPRMRLPRQPLTLPAVMTPEPPVGCGLDYVWHTDLLTLCAALPSQSVDMILADLPYGTTACTWDTVIPFAPLWAAFKRVIKPRGAIVLTASQPFTSALVMSNPQRFKYSWIWVKSMASSFQHAKNKPMKRHEDVLVFSEGTTNHESLSNNRMNYFPQHKHGEPYKKKQVTPNVARMLHRASKVNLDYVGTVCVNGGTRLPDSVLNFPNPNHNSLHPTQKPVALFEYLIRTYTQPGDVVLDPVVGSGTTAVAARNTGRHWICGDTSLEYVTIARARLRDTDPLQDRHVAPNVVQHSLFSQAAT